MKKNDLLFWIVGLCAFLAFVITGFCWLLGKLPFTGSITAVLGQIKGIATLILMVATFVAGLIWILALKCKKTARTVLLVIFIVFAAMSILGLYW